jgi:hypothetical protein
MRNQRRINGYRRRRYGTSVESQIERAVERECARYGVSKSFVIANALAFTFGIEVDEYRPKKGKK